MVLQLGAKVPSRPGVMSCFVESSSGCRKLVNFMLRSVPKYVVGATTSMCWWSSSGSE